MAEVKDTKAIQRALVGGIEDALRIMVEDLLGRAVKAAPVDEATLRGSGTASVEVKGNQVVGKVTFGVPYAERQHEETEFEHPKGGQAKFLEAPLTEMVPRYRATLAAVARRKLRGR